LARLRDRASLENTPKRRYHAAPARELVDDVLQARDGHRRKDGSSDVARNSVKGQGKQGKVAGGALAGRRRRSEQFEARAILAEAALDVLGVAIFALDGDGRLLLANRAASRLVAKGSGLELHQGRLSCVDPADAARLAAAIAAAASPGGRRTQALTVSRSRRHHSLGLLVVPLPATDGGASVLVVASDAGTAPQPRPEHLAALFTLTPAEARLAAAVASRRSLQAHAAAAGISVGTARGRLKKVLAATDCRRQSDLVHLLLTSPAALVNEDFS
jgi:DNA-binding CsgD family transcriptional regulator